MHSPERRVFGVRRLGAALTATALIGASLALSASPAAAAAPENFSRTTPGSFSVTVPNGVCGVTVEALGGAGGSVVTGVAATNGAGAHITAKYAVAAGQIFSGTVGGGGQPSTGTGQQSGNGGPNAGLGGSGVGSGGRGGTVSAGSSHAGAGGGGGTLVTLDGSDAIFAGGGGASSGGHATNGGFGGNAGLPDAVGTAKAGSDGLDGFDNPNQGTGSGIPRGGEGGQTTDAGDGGVHTTNSSLSGSDGSGRDGGNGGNDPNYDSGGGGGGGYTGGGGGASTTLNGSGNAVSGGNAGGGGGGGSSLVTAVGSPSLVSAVAGPRLGTSHNGSGADGFVKLSWELCSFDLAVAKQVTGPDQSGLTTWTVTVTNNGPGDMADGDKVTLTDTLPGPANTEITELDTPSGVTCDVDEGDPMQSPIECSALAVGEAITIVYTQTLTSAGEFTNIAEVTDDGDQSNNTSSATAEVTPPEADPGETTGPQGLPQDWTPTYTPGTFPVECTTLTLPDAVDGVVTVAGGTYTVDGCKIVFTPEPSFVGEAPPVTYEVSDSKGNEATNTYTPTVTAVKPTAPDFETVDRPNVPQSVDPLDPVKGAKPGHPDVPIVPSSLELVDADDQGKVTVPEGVYTIVDGKIVFTPKENYFGPVTPVEYQVADANGTTAKGAYQPAIEVDPPTTDNGETTGPQGVPQSWKPTPVRGQDFPIVADSLTLLDSDGEPVEKIVVDGVGSYTVASGVIVFTPLPDFVGKAPTVDYRVTDAGGQHAKGTYTPSVTAVKPVANDDASSGWWNVPQSVDPLANDEPGDPKVPLDPSSLTLLDAEGKPAASVTVPEGVYTVDRTDPAKPRLVFTPNRDYTGTPTPANYRISDTNGTPAEATYRPSVRGPQDSQDLVETEVCGKPVTLDTVGEVPGLDAGSVRLVDANGQPALELVVAGEGTWRVDSATGKVTFTPVGCLDEDPTPVNWRGTLTDGTPIVGTLTVQYTEPEAVAPDDDEDELPNTGVNPLLPAGLGGLLLIAGLVLVGTRRRGDLVS